MAGIFSLITNMAYFFTYDFFSEEPSHLFWEPWILRTGYAKKER